MHADNSLTTRKRGAVAALAALVALGVFAGSFASAAAGEKRQGKAKPKLYHSLPEWCNTPDGMTLNPDTNDIILACPNFNLQTPGEPNEDGTLRPLYPGILMKIDPKGNVSFFFPMPLHPETGRSGPMGMDFGADGNLYVADNQFFYDKDHKSRLIRVVIKDGKPVAGEVAVDGFKLSNAVVWKEDRVFVSDTFMEHPDEVGLSAVYMIKKSEMDKGTVQLKPLGTDPRKIAQFKTVPNQREDLAGADGMTLDSKGNLYVANFGNGILYKIAFDAKGDPVSQEEWFNSKKLQCSDGIFCNLETDEIYVANSQDNAIAIVSPDKKFRILAQNGDTDGADGGMDQPAEVIIRGNEAITANFDMPFPGLKNSKFDAPYTLSVIKLGKK